MRTQPLLPDGRLTHPQMGGRARSASPRMARPQGHLTGRIRANNLQCQFDLTASKEGAEHTLEQKPRQEMRKALAAAEASHAEEKEELLRRCQKAEGALRVSEAAHAEEKEQLLTRCHEAETALRTSERVQGELRIELDIRTRLLAQERHRREREVGEVQRALEELQDKVDQATWDVLSCCGTSEPRSRGPAPDSDSDSDTDSEGPWDTPGAVCPALQRRLDAMEKDMNLPSAECRAPTPPRPAPRPAPAAGHHDDAQGATNSDEAGDAKQGAAVRIAAVILAEEEALGLPGPAVPSPFQGLSVLAVVASMFDNASATKSPAALRPHRSALRPTSTLAGVTPPSANPTRRVRFEDEGDAGPGADLWVVERVAFDPIPWAGASWLPYERAAAGAVGAAAAAAAAEIQACISFLLVLVLVTAMLLVGMVLGSRLVVPQPTATDNTTPPLHITWKDRNAP